MARSLTICDSEQTSDEDDAVCPECEKIIAGSPMSFFNSKYLFCLPYLIEYNISLTCNGKISKYSDYE